MLGIELTIQLDESFHDSAEYGHMSVLQHYALQRLRSEVEDYERYMDTIREYTNEENIHTMKDNELMPAYIVNIAVGNKHDKGGPAIEPWAVKWLFHADHDGQMGSHPEHLPIWDVLRTHYVECICFGAPLLVLRENNCNVTFKGLDNFDSIEQRLMFVRTQLASVMELLSIVLVAHWEHLQNVVEDITFQVCHKNSPKRAIWIKNGSKTLYLSVATSDKSLPDIESFLLESVRGQIEISQEMQDTVNDLRERTQEFAQKLGEELGGDMAVGTIHEDDIIAGMSTESLRFLCPPSAILATRIVHQFPHLDRNVARDCIMSFVNQPSKMFWKWHVRVVTNKTPDKLRRLRFWIASDGCTDTQNKDRLLVTRDGRGTIIAHVNLQDSGEDDTYVIGRWESLHFAEFVGIEGRETAQRVDFVSWMGTMYRTSGGVDDFIEHLPNLLNVGWETKDKSFGELDASRRFITVYASDNFRQPPFLYIPGVQTNNTKDLQVEGATHFFLQKLAYAEQLLSATTFCKVNIDWTSWSRFAKEDGLAYLAIFTLLTTLDRLQAAVESTRTQLMHSFMESVDESTGDTQNKSLCFFQNVTIHFDYDISTLGNTVKQVIVANPWMLVKVDKELIVSCNKLILDDESEVVDATCQVERYADIGTNEECPLLTAFQSHLDTMKTDNMNRLLQKITDFKIVQFLKKYVIKNISLILAATLPSPNTPLEFVLVRHPHLPGDVMVQYDHCLEDAMKTFFSALSFIGQSGARKKLYQVAGVEVVLPHADDTSRTYGVEFRYGVLQYTLSPSDHTKTLVPSRSTFVKEILLALKCKAKWSEESNRQIAAQETSINERYRHGLQLPFLGSQNVFCLELRNNQGDLLSQADTVKEGDITVSVVHDSEQVTCESCLQGQTEGLLRVAWTPSVPYASDAVLSSVDIRWRGEPVKGSPFPAVLVPPDSSRHRALSRGRLVGLADGSLQVGTTWHQLVYHRSHSCRTLKELGQYIRKKEAEISGRRMTPGMFLKKHYQWRNLHRNGWQVKRKAALHVYYRQTGLEIHPTSTEKELESTKQRPTSARPRLLSSMTRPISSRQQLMTSRQRPMTSKARPVTSRQRPMSSRPLSMTSRLRPTTSIPGSMSPQERPMSCRPLMTPNNLPLQLTGHLTPLLRVTELAGGHFLLRCRPRQAGILETRVQCPICKERLQTVSTTHSVLQAARVVALPGRISTKKTYVEGA